MLSSSARASGSLPPVVNIETYVSASGKYALEVDPTDLYGDGAGRYRLMSEGKELWSATLPFTLVDAVVADDGTSMGYAYRDRHDFQFRTSDDDTPFPGNVRVVVLDAGGALRLDEFPKIKPQPVYPGSTGPWVKGILLHERDDRFTIRVQLAEGESWWAYQISSGKVLSRTDLRKASEAPEWARYTVAAKPIAGTPLNLIQWWRYDREKKQVGALFMLVNHEGQAVWSKELPADYTILGNESAENKLQAKIRAQGAILDAVQPNKFELWFAAHSQAVLFTVVHDPAAEKGWRVNETSWRPYQLPTDEKHSPPIASRPLQHLGSFKLDSTPPSSPIRDVRSFGFDADGRVGILRWISTAGYSFALIDPAGKAIAEIPLPARVGDTEIAEIMAACVGKGRWVIIGSEREYEGRSWAWWFEAEKKTLSQETALECSQVDSVAATGDGGFVVLATRRFRNTSTEELYAFDKNGKTRWKHLSSSGDVPGSMLSPEDVTVTSNGEIAVVDNIRHTVLLFDLSGKFLRKVDLEKSWGREPNYPSGIMPDVDGGFIVDDSNGKVPFMRMNADGSVREPLQPRHHDGRAIDTYLGIRIAPDGRLWTSDQHSLLRLDQKGVVELTLGEQASSETLGKITHATGDRHGKVYAVDERTGAVHVFDSEGKKLRVCKPAPGDFTGNLRRPHITVADNESVYMVKDSIFSEPGYLHFAPDGSRRGVKKFNIEGSIGQEWYAQHSTENILVLEYQTAFLMGPNDAVLKKMDRRADRLWLDHVSEAAIASDGSFAILSGRSDVYGRDSAITLFAKDGVPVRTFPFPSLVFLKGYNGSHLVFRNGNAIEIYDRHGAPVQSFPRPDGEEWSMFLTRDGRELWSVDHISRAVQRYAMP